MPVVRSTTNPSGNTDWQSYGGVGAGRYVSSTRATQGSDPWQTKMMIQQAQSRGQTPTFQKLPDIATLMNVLKEGDSFSVGGQTFRWNGRDAQQVDANGNVSSGGGSLSGLAGEFQAKMDEANAANEARYQQGMAGYGQLEGEVMGMYGGMGNQRMADIDRAAEQKYSAIGQDAVSRGLAGTTAPRSDHYGVFREAQGAKNQLAEDVTGQQANALMNIRGGALGFLERREDVAPNYDQLIRLAEMTGQAGYGGTAGLYGQMGLNQAPATGRLLNNPGEVVPWQQRSGEAPPITSAGNVNPLGGQSIDALRNQGYTGGGSGGVPTQGAPPTSAGTPGYNSWYGAGADQNSRVFGSQGGGASPAPVGNYNYGAPYMSPNQRSQFENKWGVRY
ncbi:MAG TPA: hypothetical protein VMW48_20620 [Vicinamibacterales bacterium]|nr:hypothetical protein [Vicinamibacterales bacterium]